jgi:hypothetical protein
MNIKRNEASPVDTVAVDQLDDVVGGDPQPGASGATPGQTQERTMYGDMFVPARTITFWPPRG